jgi:hypothetical protein
MLFFILSSFSSGKESSSRKEIVKDDLTDWHEFCQTQNCQGGEN